MSTLSILWSLLGLVLCAAAPAFAQAPAVTTVATGLGDLRGLAFAPNGDLSVAEAWTASGTLTTTHCFQSAIGPFTGGFTSRISRVRRGHQTPEVVASGFPSSSAAVGDIFGLADLTFDGPHLIALSGGGGCSKGHPECGVHCARHGLGEPGRCGALTVARARLDFHTAVVDPPRSAFE